MFILLIYIYMQVYQLSLIFILLFYFIIIILIILFRDWWNSPQLSTYWRTWNRPVHDWLVRHVYCVAARAGFTTSTCKIIVFFLSAVLHEVLISVPCHVISFHAFFAMFLQVPVISFTEWIYRRSGNPVFGNVTFWITLCVFGQPLLILLYGYQYIRQVLPYQ